ncbi:MAG: hypothetical protein OEU36_05135 [Gammaproteobacteria bacterium]|nr:hypothetical protein [Gammaproteobacteria bacterium]
MPENNVEFVCLYNMPGEGLVAEIKYESESLLYNRQGLQYRILKRKQDGADTSVEESALAQMNLLSVPHSL